MKHKNYLLVLLLLAFSGTISSQTAGTYKGKFVTGKGDTDYLRLIDESFAFLNPNPVVPNLTMVYRPDWDTFTEGAGWGAWWIQNSYGFSYSATPFLAEPWFSTLQRSWDLFWDNQGDGKRRGMWGGDTKHILSQLVAPDGCLGDAAAPGQIAYRQGDGDVKSHDWFYEATAAGVVMEAEILLASRNRDAISRYLPHMERACDMIERARDTRNNLFLVGPACNLLAPSYGGVKMPDGTFGKGYLTGVSITYLAAVDRMLELYKMTGDNAKIAEYERRQKLTRESLPHLMTKQGYFVKSIEPDGTMHGVLGQSKYGYMEGVANVDAVAMRVVDDKTAEGIYKQIASYKDIRPFDFLLTNAPGLDDTYTKWGSSEGLRGFWEFGQWVNGGVWGTVEGRAILMYYRLGKFEDIRRSAIRAMRWAKDFRMDAPWSQRGENTSNPWSDTGKFKEGGVAVMIDNFAIPAATIRGLFDYDYRSDRLILRPRIPSTIIEYKQVQPVRFGDKQLFISCLNGGTEIRSVRINGKQAVLSGTKDLALIYNELPARAEIEITTGGGWTEESSGPVPEYPLYPSLTDAVKITSVSLPDSLQKPYDVLKRMSRLLSDEKGQSYEKSFLQAAIKSFEDYSTRAAMDPGKGYYRPIDQVRKNGITGFYARIAGSMYSGFSSRMEKYSKSDDASLKHMSSLFAKALSEK